MGDKILMLITFLKSKTNRNRVLEISPKIMVKFGYIINTIYIGGEINGNFSKTC